MMVLCLKEMLVQQRREKKTRKGEQPAQMHGSMRGWHDGIRVAKACQDTIHGKTELREAGGRSQRAIYIMFEANLHYEGNGRH